MSAEETIRNWGGESTIIQYDRPTGAWIVIAVHSSLLGPASGGTRLKPYPGLVEAVADAHNLALSMTYKFAVAGMNRGGGKAVIAVPPDFDPAQRPDLLRRYGKLVKQLGGLFETGPDVGTSPADMDIIAETGAPHIFCRTEANGGSGDTGEATALGVFYGIQAVCEHLFGESSPAGRRVLVQGAGSVGGRLIHFLRQTGAEVLFNDVDEALIAHFRDKAGLRFVPTDAVFDTPCDIFAPCALGGILNQETIPRLKCRAVAGGANNQLAAAEDADRLRARHILYAPDYVLNIGGAMSAAAQELEGLSRAEAYERVKSVKNTTQQIFTIAEAEGITTAAAARRMAETRLAEV
jgi:glutamate dehydrogenase/leucine dehydrogenase